MWLNKREAIITNCIVFCCVVKDKEIFICFNIGKKIEAIDKGSLCDLV